jgi:probable F420-dependent oxidoreductase
VKYTVQYPLVHPGYGPELRLAASIAAFARAAESAGFDAVAFTEHPAPSHKWIASGGHDSYDPLAALACCAVSTERIRLLPYTLILPYRNPLLAAKSLATLDVISGGRLTVGVGTGYLRSEFAALGASFDERNELFDEAVEAMRGIWTTEGFAGQGRAFYAVGQTARPAPVQRPYPPFWIGGNSRRARERVARFGDAWMPLQIDAERSATVRTAPLATVDDLRVAIDDLRDLVVAAGRDPSTIDVQVEGPETYALLRATSLDQHRERLAELEEIGVTCLVVDTANASLTQAIESLERYGREVIAPGR